MTGEDRLLAAILGGLPPGGPPVLVGPGDDAAVVAGAELEAGLLLTVDAAEEGVHFDRVLHPLPAVGRRAVAAAASDIAAMGGRPLAALVSVVASPGDLDAARTVMAAAGRRGAELGAPVVGGNITRGDRLGLHVTVAGRMAEGARPLLRSGARPGDALFVSGPLGASALGLELLRDRIGSRSTDPAESPWVRAHLDPQPRLRLGVELVGVATAAMDLSDGLALDLHRLARASRCGAVVEAARLPLAAPAKLEAALFGGEDYELLFTAPRGRVTSRMAAGGAAWSGVTRIGRVVSREEGVRIATPDGRSRSLPPRGFDSLAGGEP